MSSVDRNKKIAAGLIAFALASAVAYADTYWTGAVNNDFNTAGNWDAGLPGASVRGHITNSAANVMTSAGIALTHTYVQGTGVAPTLNISHDFGIAANAYLFLGGGADNQSGVVNHTAGAFTAGRLYCAAADTGTGSNRSGTYNFSGGSIFVVTQVSIGQRIGDTGALNLSGTGSFSCQDLFIALYNGVGTLRVEGGNLVNHIAGDLKMSPYGGGSSTIEAVLDGAGFGTINVDGNVQFDNGTTANSTLFNLSLGAGYMHVPGTVYTIIEAAAFTQLGVFGNVADGQVLSIAGDNFEARYTNDATAKFTLTALAVPATELLTYEGFDYPVGTALNTTISGNGWATGWKADFGLTTELAPAFTNVLPGSLTSAAFISRGLAAVGNQLTVLAGSKVELYRGLDRAFSWSSNSVTYMSALVSWDGNHPSAASRIKFILGNTDAYFGLFGDGTTSGKLRLGVRNTSGQTFYGTNLHDKDTTYMLIVKVQTVADGSDVISVVLVDPSSTLPASEPAWALSASMARSGAMASVLGIETQLYTANSSSVDEIRLGETWNDVTADIAAALSYDSWIADYPGVGVYTNKTDNPDGDGLDNLAEFGMGGNPDDVDDIGHASTTSIYEDGGIIWMEYVHAKRKNAAGLGLDYYLEQNTTDLISGTWTGYDNVVSTNALDDEFDSVVNRLSTESGDQQFLRLRIESN